MNVPRETDAQLLGKLGTVIRSCETEAQLNVAAKYGDRVYDIIKRRLRSNFGIGGFGDTIRIANSIDNSIKQRRRELIDERILRRSGTGN